MEDQQNYELKYQLPVSASAQVLDWMRATMRLDGKYPTGLVHTLYYDTRQLAALEEKVNSDYLKTKIRLRWYATLDGKPQGENAFTEVKFRIGRLRQKLRFETPFSPEFICNSTLDAPELLSINLQLDENGVGAEGPFFPALQLVYERHRFVEPVSGARVCLDHNIAVTRTNPRFFPSGRGCKIPAAVFEYKHFDAQLPPHLFRLYEFGARRHSFSKYFACAGALADRTYFGTDVMTEAQ